MWLILWARYMLFFFGVLVDFTRREVVLNANESIELAAKRELYLHRKYYRFLMPTEWVVSHSRRVIPRDVAVVEHRARIKYSSKATFFQYVRTI